MKKSIILIPLFLLIIIGGAVSGYFLIRPNHIEVESAESNFNLDKNLVSERELEDIVHFDVQHLHNQGFPEVSIYQTYDETRQKMGPFTDYRPQPLLADTAVSRPDDTVEKQPSVEQPPVVSNPEPVTEKIKPTFKLTGIVRNDSRQLAVINTDRETLIKSRLDKIEDFKIIEIQEDRIVLSHENKRYQLMMGSDSFEN